MPETIEERVVRLEIQLAHTERICDQLNEVVTSLSRDADERNRLIKRLVEQVKDIKGKVEDFGASDDEKPPHY